MPGNRGRGGGGGGFGFAVAGREAHASPPALFRRAVPSRLGPATGRQGGESIRGAWARDVVTTGKPMNQGFVAAGLFLIILGFPIMVLAPAVSLVTAGVGLAIAAAGLILVRLGLPSRGRSNPSARDVPPVVSRERVEPRAPPGPGKIIFWIFLAALGLLLVWQFFEIQDKCLYYEAHDQWQRHLCF